MKKYIYACMAIILAAGSASADVLPTEVSMELIRRRPDMAEPESRVAQYAAHAGSFAPQLNGSMMPYDFSATDSVVPWNADMKPVFINYVARHGARFLSSVKKTANISRELTEAHSGGYLSAKGERFLRLLNKVDSATSGQWGALNATGINEEQRLGQELASIAPDLLKQGSIQAISTYVPRVVMTMYEVCHELARHSSHLEISTSEGRKYDRLLRFFTTDSAYVDYLEHGGWRKPYDDFVATHISGIPAQTLFTKKIEPSKLRKLTQEMYGILQSLPASELPWHPEEWFAEDEYTACWEASNLQHYYERSESPLSTLPAKSASVLLNDIIYSTDSALAGKTGDTVVRLRFGHAETLMPLFALMRLPGCYAPQATADDVASVWRDWEVSPLGANLLIVLLRGSNDQNYVALRLNGRWIAPANTNDKIISWDELRLIWTKYSENFVTKNN